MPTSEMHRRRRGRNIALGLALAGWVVVIFLVSLVKVFGQ
ncbi:hypothetical protein DES42_106262 [Zavarzinia compransoris]|nr:hypothetical protein DES42_106262 [Zavarzinia compransoris]